MTAQEGARGGHVVRTGPLAGPLDDEELLGKMQRRWNKAETGETGGMGPGPGTAWNGEGVLRRVVACLPLELQLHCRLRSSSFESELL